MQVLVLLLSLELSTQSHAVGLPVHPKIKIAFNILSLTPISSISLSFLFSIVPLFLWKTALYLVPTVQGHVEKLLHNM